MPSIIQITKSLKGISFPAQKADLLSRARDNDADKDILGMLKDLPDDKFGSVAEVMRAFGDKDSKPRKKAEAKPATRSGTRSKAS